MFKQSFTYPPARQDDVVDNYHGTAVPDPYRWLEDPDSAETRAWAAAQNELTQSFISQLPVRPRLEKRLTALWDYPKYTPPVQRNGRLFFQKNDGLQNQAVLYWQDGPDAAPQVLLDPNTFSEDGTVALMGQSYSDDGRLLAYSLSESGSDWQTIRIRDVDSGQDMDDVIRWVK
ncbi:MAG TPA: S9 family peptidase, partial [Chloroflexi bacterium]|nr:S9 family peptidase [Chloroflexota bacterium]